MSRANDIAKSKKLLKKYNIWEALKELYRSKKKTKAIKKVSLIKPPTNGAEAVELALGLAKYLKRAKDIKFLKSLPQNADDSVYEKLPYETREKMLAVTESLINGMKDDEKFLDEEAKSLDEKKDILVKGKVARLENEIDEWKSQISKTKTDYQFGWKCALDMRQKIEDGYFGEPTNDVAINDAYRWAVDNCTIKGEEILGYRKLIKDYENAKYGRTKSGAIIDEFEDKYYKKDKKKIKK